MADARQRAYREVPGMFEGRILPVTVRVGAPILVGNVVQFVYAAADTFFIARIDRSSTAILSGTGLMFPLFFFIMAMAMSVSVGTSALVGRGIGEKNEMVMRHVSASVLLLVASIGIPAILGGYLFGDNLVRVLGGKKLTPHALSYGLSFFRTLLPGLAVMLFGQALSGILHGQGLTRVIAKAAVLSAGTNIALDPIFIFGLKLGVAGAGLATTVAVSLSALYLISFYVRGQSAARLTLAVWRAKFILIKEILRIALPHFVSMASLSIGFMIFNKLVSTIGEDAMNAWTLVGRMDQMVLIPSFAVAGATSIMVAQNYGRNLPDRVRSVYVVNVILAVCVVGSVALIYMLIAPFLFAAFSDVPVVVAAAVRQVRLLALTFTGISVAIVSSATFQSTGRPLPALALSLVRMGLVASPAAWLFAFFFGKGMMGVYAGVALGNLLALPLALAWARRHLARLKHRSVV
jgi:putative MATE family efflux protein